MSLNTVKGFPRPVVHPWAFNIIIALIITFFQNIIFFKKIFELIDISQIGNLLFILSMPVTVLFTLNFLFSLILLPYIRKPIIILILISDAVAQYFMLSYGVLIDRGMVQNIFDTTPMESLALLSPKLVYYFLVLGVLPSLL